MSDKEAPASEPGFVKSLRAVDRAIGRVEEIVLSVLLIALILVAVYQFICRNFAPPAPFWTPEAIQYSVFFIGLLGGALATQSERLINIDMLTRLFSPRGKMVLRVICALFTIGIAYLLIKGGFYIRSVNQAMHEEGEILAPATGILALPIGAGLVALHMALHALCDIYYLAIGKLPPESTEIKVH